MQFSTFVLSALSIAGALAQSSVKVHVVRVGGSNGSLTFSPNDIQVPVGDMVQFQFGPANHTVTQSTFAQPCAPVAANSNVTGVFSGFMATTANSTNTPTYTFMVNNTTPMWLYCSQGKHCQNGMSMVINVAAGNKTLAAYQAAAKSVTTNLAPGGASASTSTSSSGTAANSPAGSAGSSDSSSSSTASAAATKATSSFATSISPSSSLCLGFLVALGMVLLA